MFRLLLDAQAIALLVKLSHAISFRIAYPITEDGSLVILLSISYSLCQDLVQASTIKDVIFQNKAGQKVLK